MEDKELEFEPLYTFSLRKRKLLKKAIDTEDLELIRTLFTTKRFHYKDTDEEDEGPIWTDVAPLQYAYEQGKREVVLALLNYGVDPGWELHHEEMTLIEQLIRKNDLEMLEKVLPYVENPHAIHVYTMDDYRIKTTKLGLCACLGNVEASKLLMRHGYLMKPWTVEEALERDEDCCGVYQGAFNMRKEQNSEYYGMWKEQMLEPWQFGAFCEDPEASAFFFGFGEDGWSEGFSEMILYVRSKEIIEQIEQRFPNQMKLAFGKKHQNKILAAANADLLARFDLKDINISCLGAECLDTEQILHCYEILKERLPRELMLEEKRSLVKLMLQRKDEKLIGICEREWVGESEPCDISEWADWIPTSGPICKEFTKRLEQSTLNLVIHPEHSIFDERYYYFDSLSGVMRQVRCLDHAKNLSVLDRVVRVIPPEEEGEELIYFTKKVLDMGKKTAFQRLKKWGLVHEGNMAKVSEYIVENNLEQFYEQAIRAGETRGNQKTYQL